MVDGQFRLDHESMPQVISDLTEARSHLAELLGQLGTLTEHGPVGADEVSRNFVAQLRRLGVAAEPGSLAAAAESYLAAMDDSIAALQDMVKHYRRADEAGFPAPAGIDLHSPPPAGIDLHSSAPAGIDVTGQPGVGGK